MVQFKKAERKQAKLKLALTGVSGAGKTFSALRMATGIGGRIAVIDTENGSASLYADKFDFETVQIEPPFTTDKYVEAINAAEAQGFDIIIVDSFSHAWAGEGGTLDRKINLDARGGNHFTNWKGPKQDYAKAKNALLHSSLHVIATIRSKQTYVLVDDNGKQKPQKMGLDPIAEPMLEYEFSAVLDISADNNAMATKDRTSLFKKDIFIITEETGKKLLAWLMSGKVEEQAPRPAAQAPAKEPVQTVQAPKPSPLAKPEGCGVFCDVCKAELILHPSKAGYVCLNSTKKDDGHTRFVVGKLAEYQARAKTFEQNQSADAAL